MTAAMRDWNEPSTDGPRNLIASIRVATKPSSIEEGVLVCLNDEIHAAREVTKPIHQMLPLLILQDMDL